MRIASRTLAAVACLAAVGCAAIPPGPSVQVLRGSLVPPDRFGADDAACRADTVARLGGPDATFDSAYEAQRVYDYAYVHCMYSLGHSVPDYMVGSRDRLAPVQRSETPRTASPPPPPPASSPPPPPPPRRSGS